MKEALASYIHCWLVADLCKIKVIQSYGNVVMVLMFAGNSFLDSSYWTSKIKKKAYDMQIASEG